MFFSSRQRRRMAGLEMTGMATVGRTLLGTVARGMYVNRDAKQRSREGKNCCLFFVHKSIAICNRRHGPTVLEHVRMTVKNTLGKTSMDHLRGTYIDRSSQRCMLISVWLLLPVSISRFFLTEIGHCTDNKEWNLCFKKELSQFSRWTFVNPPVVCPLSPVRW